MEIILKLYLGHKTNQFVLSEIQSAMAVVTNTLMHEGQPTILCEASLLSTTVFFQEMEELLIIFLQVIDLHLIIS